MEHNLKSISFSTYNFSKWPETVFCSDWLPMKRNFVNSFSISLMETLNKTPPIRNNVEQFRRSFAISRKCGSNLRDLTEFFSLILIFKTFERLTIRLFTSRSTSVMYGRYMPENFNNHLSYPKNFLSAHSVWMKMFWNRFFLSFFDAVENLRLWRHQKFYPSKVNSQRGFLLRHLWGILLSEVLFS